MSLDPCVTNPDHYKVIFENDRVRVLEYKDKPGDRTTPHQHPDSVMYTRSAFRRRLYGEANEQREVEMQAGLTGWLPAQQHSGHNIGETDTHVIFVELKERNADSPSGALGPECQQVGAATSSQSGKPGGADNNPFSPPGGSWAT